MRERTWLQISRYVRQLVDSPFAIQPILAKTGQDRQFCAGK